ncbi:hypothetical protein ACFQU2_37100 [Siccirubricoccus deserti]
MHSGDGGLRESGTGGIAADMLLGAVAGAVGVWVMDRVDWFMFRHEDPEARWRTQAVRPGEMDPAHVMANKAAEAAIGAELAPAASSGRCRGPLRHRHRPGRTLRRAAGARPVVGTGRGLLYGLSLFLVHDELLNAATGLSADPRRYPWQAHARGLVAHLVYGAVTDAVLDLLHQGRSQVR